MNLLHPYPGNTSLLGDCMKLQATNRSEQRGVIAIKYEHDPAQVSLEKLWRSFEVIAGAVLNIELGPRVEAHREGVDPSRSSTAGGRGLGNLLRIAAKFLVGIVCYASAAIKFLRPN